MNKYNTRVKGNCIAFALLIAGLTTTTLGTQASSSSDYLLVEDNFSSTQINSSASNIISESGFTDIQYISVGSTPTPVPTTPPPTTTIATTPTPIPITQTPTTTSSTSSSSGGGGSDPLIIEKLSKQTIIPEDIHNSAQSPPPTFTPIPITQTSENTTPTSRPTTTPLPYPTHLPSSTTAVIPTPSITQTTQTQTHTNQQNNYSNTLTDITGDTEISEYINKNLKEKKNNISTEEQIFHNSATQQIEQEHITQTKTNEETNEESNEENAKFFCTASSFTTYALLLIIFLLGMIFQSILHKTFYTHKK